MTKVCERCGDELRPDSSCPFCERYLNRPPVSFGVSDRHQSGEEDPYVVAARLEQQQARNRQILQSLGFDRLGRPHRPSLKRGSPERERIAAWLRANGMSTGLGAGLG